jgi:hypothetical protein
MKAKIYSRLDYIKEATKNYTLEATPADLTGVLQQVGSRRLHSTVCICIHNLKY